MTSLKMKYDDEMDQEKCIKSFRYMAMYGLKVLDKVYMFPFQPLGTEQGQVRTSLFPSQPCHTRFEGPNLNH